MSGKGFLVGSASAWLLAALLSSGSVAQENFAGVEEAEDPYSESAMARRVSEASTTDFGRALVAAVKAYDRPHSVRIFTRCANPDGIIEQAEIFGNGVFIWNEERQFTLEPRSVQGLLRTLLINGFAELPESAVSRPTEQPAEDEATPRPQAPLRILCELEVEIAGERKRVERTNKSGRLPELEAITGRILRFTRMHAVWSGITVKNLEQGLAKVFSGDLAPETLKVIFSERSELSQPESPGVLFELRGTRLSVRHHSRASGYDSPSEVALTPEQFSGLAGELFARRVATMPVNLFAKSYIDLTVEVLSHRVSVQARRFAGMSAATHGESQQNFDALAAFLRALANSGNAPNESVPNPDLPPAP